MTFPGVPWPYEPCKYRISSLQDRCDIIYYCIHASRVETRCRLHVPVACGFHENTDAHELTWAGPTRGVGWGGAPPDPSPPLCPAAEETICTQLSVCFFFFILFWGSPISLCNKSTLFKYHERDSQPLTPPGDAIRGPNRRSTCTIVHHVRRDEGS